MNISSIKLLQVDLENPLDSLIEIPDLKMIIQLYKLLTFEKANAPDTRENKDNKYFWVHFKSDLRRSVDYENHYKAMQSMHNFCVEISQLKNHVNLGKPLESFFK